MKTLMKSLAVCVMFILSACSSTSTQTRLSESELDQKSYAISYAVTAQEYASKVNELFDGESFIRGANDWLDSKVKLPLEQIEAMTANRYMEHSTYVYYDGVRYAGLFQRKVSELDPSCWSLIDKPSMKQGLNDAIRDLKNGTPRKEDDPYITKGADEILHLCVKTIADDEKQPKKAVKKSKTKSNKK